MTNRNVYFIDRDYTISSELPKFVKILEQFENYSDELYKIVISQARAGEYVGNADVDFVKWKTPIESIAKKVIQSAADYGVYDLTLAELVNRNPGVKQLNNVCEQTFQEIKNILLASIQNFKNGLYSAERQAASGITGSGVSIWTSSISSLLIYNAFEMSTIRKQCSQADREFKKAIEELGEKTTDQEKQEETRVLTQIYYPGCNSAIPSIVSYMLEVYLKRINATGGFDYDAVRAYDLSCSSEILKNVDLVPNKKEVIIKAFEKCPYNPDVYKKLIDEDMVDFETFETAKYLHQSKLLIPYLYELIALKKEYEIDASEVVKVLASFEEVQEKDIYRKIFKEEYTAAINGYSAVVSAINDDDACTQWVSDNITNKTSLLVQKKDTIHEEVDNAIRSILDQDMFNTLIENGALDASTFNFTGKESTDYNSIMSDLSERLIPKVNNVVAKAEKRIQEFQAELARLTSEINKLIQLHETVESNYHAKEEALQEEKKKCGIFAFSKKKEIDKELVSLISEKAIQLKKIENEMVPIRQRKSSVEAEMEKI